MSRIIGIVGKSPSGASTYSVECAGCKRIYQTTNTRSRVESQVQCLACTPLVEMAAHARAVANAEGTAHRWRPSEAQAAGRKGGAVTASKCDMGELARLSNAKRYRPWRTDNRPLWQRALESRSGGEV